MLNSVFIFGFPHSGTSIMRKIAAGITGLPEHKEETKEVIGRGVFKWPWPEPTDADASIFILRQPDFVFSSLSKRFQCKEVLVENHTLSTYEKAFDLFERFDGFRIKYEDLFVDGVDRVSSYLGGGTYNHAAGVEFPKPLNYDHVNYRYWQLSQPFKNMNYDNNHFEDAERMSDLIIRYKELSLV